MEGLKAKGELPLIEVEDLKNLELIRIEKIDLEV